MINGTLKPFTAVKPTTIKSQLQINHFLTNILSYLQSPSKHNIKYMGVIIYNITQTYQHLLLMFKADIIKFEANNISKNERVTTVKKTKMGEIGTRTRKRNQESTRIKTKEKVRREQITNIQELLELQLSSTSNKQSNLSNTKIPLFINNNENIFDPTDLSELPLKLTRISEDIILHQQQNEENIIPKQLLQITASNKKTRTKTHQGKNKSKSKKYTKINDHLDQMISHANTTSQTQLSGGWSQLNSQNSAKRKLVTKKGNPIRFELLQFEDLYKENIFDIPNWKDDIDAQKLQDFFQQQLNFRDHHSSFNSQSQISNQLNMFSPPNNIQALSEVYPLTEPKTQFPNKSNPDLQIIKSSIEQGNLIGLNAFNQSMGLNKHEKSELLYELLSSGYQMSQGSPQNFSEIYLSK